MQILYYFIGDFSLYSWLFPLKQKSDMPECFIIFKCLIENLLSYKSKQLQTNGGGEYTSHPFKQFLSTHDIHHRITFPQTSQQNNRHVIKTGLALLVQSHLPPKHCGEACLMVVYLINPCHHTPAEFHSIWFLGKNRMGSCFGLSFTDCG